MTWRIALLGLVGVIVAGLIGAVSAYLTSKSQSDEDRQSFIRQQRQTAYAALAGEAQAHLDFFTNCAAGLLTTGVAIDIQYFRSVEDTVAGFSDKVGADAAAVELVGSQRASADAERITGDYKVLGPGCEAVVALKLTKESSIAGATGEEVTRQISSALGNLSNDVDRLIVDGHADLD